MLDKTNGNESEVVGWDYRVSEEEAAVPENGCGGAHLLSPSGACFTLLLLLLLQF